MSCDCYAIAIASPTPPWPDNEFFDELIDEADRVRRRPRHGIRVYLKRKRRKKQFHIGVIGWRREAR